MCSINNFHQKFQQQINKKQTRNEKEPPKNRKKHKKNNKKDPKNLKTKKIVATKINEPEQ